MTTPAIEKSVLMTRALLTDDIETFRRLNADLDDVETRAFAALFTAAFFKAANDKFGKDYSVAGVIELGAAPLK